MAVRTRTSPLGTVRFSQALPVDVHRQKIRPFSYPGKPDLILLVGDIPKPLSLAPIAECLIDAGNGKEFINHRPMAAFTKRSQILWKETEQENTRSRSD